MIQAWHKYRPASFGALALLCNADGKDRLMQIYNADMLRAIAMSLRPGYEPTRLYDALKAKPRKHITSDKARSFVDDMIRTFAKGGNT